MFRETSVSLKLQLFFLLTKFVKYNVIFSKFLYTVSAGQNASGKTLHTTGIYTLETHWSYAEIDGKDIGRKCVRETHEWFE